eukprot:1002794_1
MQTNEEWFIVQYGNNKRKKMQRFCAALRCTQTPVTPQHAQSRHQHHDQKAFDIDFSIYQNKQKACDCINEGYIETCISFQRISTGLRYYSLFDIDNNKNDEETFTDFINDVYPLREMHNDYTHIIRKHQHQIQDIKPLLIAQGVFDECNLSNCAFTTRHHAGEEKDESEDTL